MNVNSAPVLEERSRYQQRGLRPNVSVILLSQGSFDRLEQAVVAITDAVFAIKAQLIIVRECSQGASQEAAQRLASLHRCSLAFAERGSDRAALAARGLELATGDIVTIRYDANVGAGDWLDNFARGPGTRPPVSGTEDRLVAAGFSDETRPASGRAGLDRGRPAHSTGRLREQHSRSGS